MNEIIKIVRLIILVIVSITVYGLDSISTGVGSTEQTGWASSFLERINKKAQPIIFSTENGSFSTDSFPPAFLKRAQRILDNYRNKTASPGVAVALYSNGKSCFLFSGNDGTSNHNPLTPRTAFAMGSVEKVFTSTLLALAVVQGRASLNDPAAEFLTTENGLKVKRRAAFWKITLKNLVTHTSALPRKIPHSSYRVGTDLFHDRPLSLLVLKFLNSWRPKYKPGTKYKYSNLGFVLAGHVAVNLEKESYNKLLEENLTGPIGMSRTGMICQSPDERCAVAYDNKNQPETQKPVGLWTCVEDMLRFIEANLGVLKMPTTLEQAIALTHEELFKVDNDHAVGMGWEEWHHGDSLLLSKDGLDSGFSSWVGFEPHRKCGVVVLRNGGKKPDPVELGKKLMAAVASE